jgi:nicotinate-nucleotide adenylyltransferase
MKKVGLYFGSFNPIHVGHLVIANHFANVTELNEIWFVVSPQNPLKKKASLLADNHRLTLVREAVADNNKLRASNIEFDLPKPSYTVYTLQLLKEKYPDHQFSLIMGEDNLRTLHKWKNYEYILENYDIYVYPRVFGIDEAREWQQADNDFIDRPNVHYEFDAPVMKVSSSYIRQAIKNKRDVRYLLTEPVFKYLDEMNFYK